VTGCAPVAVSALASFVLPSTDTLIDIPLANAGTFLGAVCFLVGAALMLPARRRLAPPGGTRCALAARSPQHDRLWTGAREFDGMFRSATLKLRKR